MRSPAVQDACRTPCVSSDRCGFSLPTGVDSRLRECRDHALSFVRFGPRRLLTGNNGPQHPFGPPSLVLWRVICLPQRAMCCCARERSLRRSRVR